MGIRLINNFKKRFGNRPIRVVYSDKQLSQSEKHLQNGKIVEAFKAVLAGILKREPTEKELCGLEDISTKLPTDKGAS